MYIPDKIKIGARTYRVIIIDPDTETIFDRSADGNLLGQIDHIGLTIKLLCTQAREQMAQSLLHEIVHGIAYDMGYNGDHNEREIDLLASELHRLIQDNPALFTGK